MYRDMNYHKRLTKVIEYIDRQKVDALLLKNPSNIFYLTGLIETEGLLLLDKKHPSLFVSGLYRQECLDRLAGKEAKIQIYALEDFKKFLGKYGKIAFISSEIDFALFTSFKKQIKPGLVPVPDILKDIRMFKEPGEISLIKKSLQINRKVFKEIGGKLKEGRKETEIAGDIHRLIRKFGGRREAFEPIAASGINSSYPHHKNGGRRLKKGEPVIIDAGTDFGGYKSDLTRTFFVGGKPSTKKFRDIFNTLNEVVEKTMDFAKPGKKGKEVHFFAADMLKRHKLGEYFVHGIGHGVGIDVHEKPVLNSRSEDVIKKGCVFTIEPGVYIAGKGGIRIEEMLIID